MWNRNTPVHKVALRNFTLLTLAGHSEEESKYLRACQNHTKKTWIFQAPAAPAMKKLLFCWMRKDAGGVDATWRISSSSLRMSARQDCFEFERPQVVFYCNFSCSRHVSKSANLIGRIVFDAARQTKKTNPRHFETIDAFTRGVFRVGELSQVLQETSLILIFIVSFVFILQKKDKCMVCYDRTIFENLEFEDAKKSKYWENRL